MQKPTIDITPDRLWEANLHTPVRWNMVNPVNISVYSES